MKNKNEWSDVLLVFFFFKYYFYHTAIDKINHISIFIFYYKACRKLPEGKIFRIHLVCGRSTETKI